MDYQASRSNITRARRNAHPANPVHEMGIAGKVGLCRANRSIVLPRRRRITLMDQAHLQTRAVLLGNQSHAQARDQAARAFHIDLCRGSASSRAGALFLGE